MAYTDNFAAAVLAAIGPTLWDLWWLWVFIILLPLFRSTWLFWKQEQMKSEINWILLEMRIPREAKRSPRGMEQTLAGFHALRNVAGDFREEYIDGEVTRWFSLEIVSFGGEIHYYLRIYKKQRGLVEAAIYSYYPDVELVEVEDYVNRFPETVDELDAQGYDVWGTEMLLKKPGCFPIKTYLDFEAQTEEREFDPTSAFLEVLAKLKKEEIVGIQVNIAPTSPNWRDDYADEVKKLKEQKIRQEPSMAEFVRISAQRTPGEADVLKALEENLSLPAFNTLIRFAYLSPKSMFYDSFARRGLIGSFNQYASYDLNYFVQNYAISTRTRIWNKPYIFPKRRGWYRKARLLYVYRYRKNPIKTFMGKLLTSYLFNWNFSSARSLMTTRCIATLYHPPTAPVLTAPHVKRVESKKAGPPSGLAIYGDEGSIEKFM